MPRLSDFKALLFDVDTTLTNTARKVSPSVQAALQKLADAGKILGTCTGRPMIGLRKTVAPLFPKESLHVVSGGAQVVDSSGNPKWEKLLSTEQVQELLELARATGEDFFYLPGPEVGYATDLFIEKYTALHDLVPELTPLQNMTPQPIPIIPFLRVPDAFAEGVKARTDLTLKFSRAEGGYPCIEITALGVNKATAIQEWCKLQNLTPDQVIGFGDSSNDLEFLQMVGFAVAMGNATPEIKAVADRVIGDADQDGLGEYLQEVLEKNEL